MIGHWPGVTSGIIANRALTAARSRRGQDQPGTMVDSIFLEA